MILAFPNLREFVNYRHPAPRREEPGSVLACRLRFRGIRRIRRIRRRVPGGPFGSTPLADWPDLAGKGQISWLETLDAFAGRRKRRDKNYINKLPINRIAAVLVSTAAREVT